MLYGRCRPVAQYSNGGGAVSIHSRGANQLGILLAGATQLYELNKGLYFRTITSSLSGPEHSPIFTFDALVVGPSAGLAELVKMVNVKHRFLVPDDRIRKMVSRASHVIRIPRNARRQVVGKIIHTDEPGIVKRVAELALQNCGDVHVFDAMTLNDGRFGGTADFDCSLRVGFASDAEAASFKSDVGNAGFDSVDLR